MILLRIEHLCMGVMRAQVRVGELVEGAVSYLQLVLQR
jgi:hypothetical protein